MYHHTLNLIYSLNNGIEVVEYVSTQCYAPILSEKVTVIIFQLDMHQIDILL